MTSLGRAAALALALTAKASYGTPSLPSAPFEVRAATFAWATSESEWPHVSSGVWGSLASGLPGLPESWETLTGSERLRLARADDALLKDWRLYDFRRRVALRTPAEAPAPGPAEAPVVGRASPVPPGPELAAAIEAYPLLSPEEKLFDRLWWEASKPVLEANPIGALVLRGCPGPRPRFLQSDLRVELMSVPPSAGFVRIKTYGLIRVLDRDPALPLVESIQPAAMSRYLRDHPDALAVLARRLAPTTLHELVHLCIDAAFPLDALPIPHGAISATIEEELVAAEFEGRFLFEAILASSEALASPDVLSALYRRVLSSRLRGPRAAAGTDASPRPQAKTLLPLLQPRGEDSAARRATLESARRLWKARDRYLAGILKRTSPEAGDRSLEASIRLAQAEAESSQDRDPVVILDPLLELERLGTRAAATPRLKALWREAAERSVGHAVRRLGDAIRRPGADARRVPLYLTPVEGAAARLGVALPPEFETLRREAWEREDAAEKSDEAGASPPSAPTSGSP